MNAHYPFEFRIFDQLDRLESVLEARIQVKDKSISFSRMLDLRHTPSCLYAALDEMKDIFDMSRAAGDQYIWYFETGEII